MYFSYFADKVINGREAMKGERSMKILTHFVFVCICFLFCALQQAECQQKVLDEFKNGITFDEGIPTTTNPLTSKSEPCCLCGGNDYRKGPARSPSQAMEACQDIGCEYLPENEEKCDHAGAPRYDDNCYFFSDENGSHACFGAVMSEKGVGKKVNRTSEAVCKKPVCCQFPSQTELVVVPFAECGCEQEAVVGPDGSEVLMVPGNPGGVVVRDWDPISKCEDPMLIREGPIEVEESQNVVLLPPVGSPKTMQESPRTSDATNTSGTKPKHIIAK
jgi:hypothetical protein